MAAQRILVVGAGGIGGIVTAALLEHDPSVVGEVVALTTNQEIARVTAERGLRLCGEDGDRVVPGRAVTELPAGTAPFDVVLLATQPPQVEEAARTRAALLSPRRRDGVPPERALRAARRARSRARRGRSARSSPGARPCPSPGVYERTVGRRLRDRPLLARRTIRPAGDARAPAARGDRAGRDHDNLAGTRWSKLAINCAISSLGTIGGDRLGALMQHRFVRRLALEIMTECVAVARSASVRLEKVSGTVDLDWIALTEAERGASGSSVAASPSTRCCSRSAFRYRRMRSSMLAAIERGRTPAVDFLNGEITSRGERHGIPTRINAEATRLVHAIARRELAPGLPALRALHAHISAPEAEPGL